MLHLILGMAGTGKTTELYKRLAQGVRAGRQAILLVPEQFSFESECALYDLLGEQEAQNVQVLSFTRLCHKIFYRYGQVARKVLDLPARYLLMSLALEQVRESLTLYLSQARKASFVKVMLDAIGELKNAGTGPEDFLKAGEGCENERLRQKVRELGLIFAAYQALTEKSSGDSADDISRAILLARGNRFFEGQDIYLDGFTALMAPEWAFIKEMLPECASFTAALCTPGLSDYFTNLFSPAAKTARRFVSLANEAGVAVASPQIQAECYRPKTPALRHLFAFCLREGEAFLEPQSAVQILPCADSYDECECIAREIRVLVDECGYRYRDIAVIGRDLSGYGEIFCDLFQKFNIPLCLDIRESVEVQPLVNLIICALLAVRGSLDTAQLVALSKLPLLGLREQDAFELENYCYIWNVRGRLWQSPFCNHPDGMDAAQSEQSKARLARIENARKTLITPLLGLREALREATGTSFAQGIYRYLNESGALERLPEVCPVAAEREYVDVQSALFERVMDILDDFYEILGDRPFEKTRLIELFRLALRACDTGKLPQTLDEVLIGTADRIRPGEIRAAFLFGAKEGQFPLQAESTGVLAKREREELKKQGVALLNNREDRLLLERFYAYFALCTPAERLFVSYSTRTAAGEEQRESEMVRSLLGLFPGCEQTAEPDPLRGISTEQNAFEALCRVYRADTPLRAALLAHFEDSPRLASLNASIKAVKDKNFTIEDADVANGLFGSTIALSPSRLERYYGCAFAYFCEGGLRLKKRRRVEFSPLDSGSLIHYVLECTVKKYCQQTVPLPDQRALKAEISTLIEEYLGERIQDSESVDKRFRYLYSRLVGLLYRLICHICEEFSQSEFCPVAFELPITPDSENKPLLLKTPQGNSVYVQGIVDRVDLLESAQGNYLRVVDYKSGSKVFSLTDIVYGLNLQMLIYLFTLSENGQGVLSGARPAGVLYMPAKESVVTTERAASEEQIAAEHQNGFRMNGLLLDNISVLAKMERSVSGVFIPAKLKKDGTLDSFSAVASASELGKIRTHIERLICSMADRLLDGRVPALPADGLGYDPCRWCDFKKVCRRQEDDPKRTLESMSREDTLKAMEEVSLP